MNIDDVFDPLIVVVSEVGAQVYVPIESEDFFERLAADFHGTPADFIAFVRANIKDWFKSVNSSPEWLQEAEWQFHDGHPMVFLGQISIPKSSGLFHDDAAVFVFHSASGVTKTIIQVA